MPPAKALGHQHLNPLTDQFRKRVAKHIDRARVGVANYALRIRNNDGVRGELEEFIGDILRKAQWDALRRVRRDLRRGI